MSSDDWKKSSSHHTFILGNISVEPTTSSSSLPSSASSSSSISEHFQEDEFMHSSIGSEFWEDASDWEMEYKNVGLVSFVLFSLLAVVICFRLVHHIRGQSRLRRIVFHWGLFFQILLKLPQMFVFWRCPSSDVWIVPYISNLVSLFFQYCCICFTVYFWSEVVSAGLTKKVKGSYTTKRIILLCAITIGSGTVAAISSALQQEDNLDAQREFTTKNLIHRLLVSLTSISLVILCNLYLVFGIRLHHRLSTLPYSMHSSLRRRSLMQLNFSLGIMISSLVVRVILIVALLFPNSFAYTMSVFFFYLFSNIIPTTVPTLCMLYLMRRISKTHGNTNSITHVSSIGACLASPSYQPEATVDMTSFPHPQQQE